MGCESVTSTASGAVAAWRRLMVLLGLGAACVVAASPFDSLLAQTTTQPPATQAAVSQPPRAALPVPQSVIQRMQAQSVSPDANLGLADKERRYRTILSEGEAAERRYADAPNLHVIRNLMLDAAVGMASIHAQADSVDRIRAISLRLLESDAPQPEKVKADALMTEDALFEVTDAARVEEVVAEFVQRYAGTPAEIPSMQWAITYTAARGHGSIAAGLAKKLGEDHGDKPGIMAFVAKFAPSYVTAVIKKGPFMARLARLDGKGEILIPADTFGQNVLICFWNASDPRTPASLNALRNIHARYRHEGLAIVDVNIDTSRDVATKALPAGANWHHAFSGLGERDPLAMQYGVTQGAPCYMLVQPDGKVGWTSWQRKTALPTNFMSGGEGKHLEASRRYLAFRSGDFLLESLLENGRLPAEATDGLPKDLAEAIASEVCPAHTNLSPHARSRRCRELIRLGLQAEKDHPDAPGLPIVRSLMLMAMQWLHVHTGEIAEPPPLQEWTVFTGQKLDLAGRTAMPDAQWQRAKKAWPKWAASAAGELNVGDLVDGQFRDGNVAVAFSEVIAASAGTLTVNLSAEDSVEIAANGQVLATAGAEPQKIDIPLREGTNLVAVKVTAGQKTWAFRCVPEGAFGPAQQSVEERMAELSARILASGASPQARLCADYVAERWALRSPKIAPAQAKDRIEAFVARNAQAGQPYVRILAAMLAGQFCPETAKSFSDVLAKDHFDAPWVATFLNAFVGEANKGRTVEAAIVRAADKSRIQLPGDLLGERYIICFWSTANPPPDLVLEQQTPLIIGVNMDESQAAAEEFIRDNCPDWTHVVSGKGWADETARRLDVHSLPSIWTVGADGTVCGRFEHFAVTRYSPVNAVDSHLPAGAVLGGSPNLHWRPEEGWHNAKFKKLMPLYSTGEFLIGTVIMPQELLDPSSGLPADLAKAITEQTIRPHMDASPDEKAARCREVLRLGAQTEQTHAGAPGLATVRNLMMVAGRWLAVNTGDKSADQQAFAVADRVLAAKPAAAPQQLLAEFVAAHGKVASNSMKIADAAKFIDDFHARACKLHEAYGPILAYVLAWDSWQVEAKYHKMVANKYRPAMWEHIGKPWVWPFVLHSGGIDESARHPMPVVNGKLTLLKGGEMDLRGGLAGKAIVLHFWTIAAPPAKVDVPAPPGVAIVGVNLDPARMRGEVERYAAENFPGWIHGFSGKGFDDPIALACDVHHAPATWVLGLDGKPHGSRGVGNLYTSGKLFAAQQSLQDRAYSRIFAGAAMSGTAPLLWDDGSLSLPEGLGGKPAILFVWPDSWPRMLLRDSMACLERLAGRCAGDAPVLVSMGAGASRKAVQDVFSRRRQGWVEVFTDKGFIEGLIDRYGMWHLPSVWLIGADGKVLWYRDSRMGADRSFDGVLGALEQEMARRGMIGVPAGAAATATQE